MVIEFRVVCMQFWTEITLVILNRRFHKSIISDQIALHLSQLPLEITTGILSEEKEKSFKKNAKKLTLGPRHVSGSFEKSCNSYQLPVF